MKKNKSVILSITALVVLLAAGPVTVESAQTVAPATSTVIKEINVMDNAVEIKGDRPFIYTIYKPSDPYRVIVEIPDAAIGAFKSIIKSGKDGITEVSPSQVNSPKQVAKIEILLQSPTDVDPRYLNNSLLLKVRKGDLEPPSENIRAEKEEKIAELKTAAADPEPKPEMYQKAESKSSLPKATEVTDVSFERGDGVLKVVIKGNGSMSPSVFTLKNRIVIDVPDVSMKAEVPSVVMSPVKGIRAGKHNDKMRLVLDLHESRDFDVLSVKDTIIISLKTPETAVGASKITAAREAQQSQMAEEKKEAETKPEESLDMNEPEILVGGKYTGKKISLDFQDADIVPIFRLLSDISGYNIVVSPEVKGKLTMKLINVPWDQALDLILKTATPPLDKIVDGNIIRISTLDTFKKERESKAAAMKAAVELEPLETRSFSISYADVTVVEKAIKDSKVLTPRGSLSVDKRTSSMTIKDVASVFRNVEDLLATLDRPTPQVLIEARIVEVSANDSRDLGIQWGGHISAVNTLTTLGGFPTLNKGAFTGNNFLVDFPSGAVGTGSGSGFSFGIINPAKTLGLDLQLAALGKIGRTKIISTPKIVTTDNVTAKISQGESFPYPQATAEGTISAAYKDVAISIEVTPHITPANSISMAVVTTKEDFKEFVQIGTGQAPRTTKIEGKTTVLVQDGETLVIGGVYKKTELESESGVPGLMKIPILGWLFKTSSKSEDISELLIFITPRIVQKPASVLEKS